MMNTDRVTIAFHSTGQVVFDPSIVKVPAIRETETGFELTASAGRTILETLDALGIRLSQPAVALVNGRTEDFNYVLQPGDAVTLLFQIAGG